MRKGFEEYESNVEEALEKLGDLIITFTEGRRNDDMFNWTMCMIAMTDIDDATALMNELLSEWYKFYENKLDDYQKDAMRNWDRSGEDMIDYCCHSYNALDPIMFGQLWIEMDNYDNPFTKAID